MLPLALHIFIALGTVSLATMALVVAFFAHGGHIKTIPPLSLPPITITSVTATSSPPATTVVATTTATSTPVVVVSPKPKPPVQPKPSPIIVASTTAPVISPPPVTSIGTTTLIVQSVPLLFGGIAHGGGSVPVSYLQITNVGKDGAMLRGFWIQQNGSAPGAAVIGLATVDDMGGSRGLIGGSEGFTPFQNGAAFATTTAYFAPGQMRLFTIKALLTYAVTPYLGTQLVVGVTSLDTTASVQGSFPIQGTTWTIAQ